MGGGLLTDMAIGIFRRPKPQNIELRLQLEELEWLYRRRRKWNTTEQRKVQYIWDLFFWPLRFARKKFVSCYGRRFI